MQKTLTLTFTNEADRDRIIRWASAQNLRPTTAVKKVLFDAIDAWEGRLDASND